MAAIACCRMESIALLCSASVSTGQGFAVASSGRASSCRRRSPSIRSRSLRAMNAAWPRVRALAMAAGVAPNRFACANASSTNCTPSRAPASNSPRRTHCSGLFRSMNCMKTRRMSAATKSDHACVPNDPLMPSMDHEVTLATNAAPLMRRARISTGRSSVPVGGNAAGPSAAGDRATTRGAAATNGAAWAHDMHTSHPAMMAA